VEAVLTHDTQHPVQQLLHAQAKFAAALAASPGDNNAYNMRGLSFRILADHVSTVEHKEAARSHAVHSYLTALRQRPVFPEALLNLGNVLCDRGRLVIGCACFFNAMLVNPQCAPALNRLAFHASKDTRVAAGAGAVPQMKRLLMEVAGRTAVLADELFYAVYLLRRVVPDTFAHVTDALLHCLRRATASERATAVCTAQLVPAAYRVVAELPVDDAAVSIALCFLERVNRLFEVVWPAKVHLNQAGARASAVVAMAAGVDESGVLPALLAVLRGAHPESCTGSPWRLPSVYLVMAVRALSCPATIVGGCCGCECWLVARGVAVVLCKQWLVGGVCFDCALPVETRRTSLCWHVVNDSVLLCHVLFCCVLFCSVLSCCSLCPCAQLGASTLD